MPPKAEPARLSRHYRWTPEDLRILRECQALDGRAATDVIRRALLAYLEKLRRDKAQPLELE
jgi:hypothetical protein